MQFQTLHVSIISSWSTKADVTITIALRTVCDVMVEEEPDVAVLVVDWRRRQTVGWTLLQTVRRHVRRVQTQHQPCWRHALLRAGQVWRRVRGHRRGMSETFRWHHLELFLYSSGGTQGSQLRAGLPKTTTKRHQLSNGVSRWTSVFPWRYRRATQVAKTSESSRENRSVAHRPRAADVFEKRNAFLQRSHRRDVTGSV